MAQESSRVASQRYRRYHDRKACISKFKIVDDVLLLLPTEHSKLLMKWKCPYTVINVSRLVDHRIDVDGKVKIFHVNMLCKYER